MNDHMTMRDKLSLDRTPRRRRSRCHTAGSLTALVLALFVCTAGVAGAATPQKASARQHVSAAADQYNKKSVIKPVNVSRPRTVKASAVAGVHASVKKPSTAATTLPFTGLSLVTFVAVGLALIGLGFALRRRHLPAPGDRA